MKPEHIEKNIVSRKRKARSRRNHLRRLQKAYDRLQEKYCSHFEEHLSDSVMEFLKTRKKKWYQFWK